jgi:hypothetical protein
MTNKNYIEKAIEKAMKGGWKSEYNYVVDEWQHPNNQKIITSDPKFWIALGKSLRWRVASGSNMNHQWKNEWHNFIDHLAAEKPANDFFASLLEDK